MVRIILFATAEAAFVQEQPVRFLLVIWGERQWPVGQEARQRYWLRKRESKENTHHAVLLAGRLREARAL
eukprot:1116339-Pyramimonas_sp.AAC.1